VELETGAEVVVTTDRRLKDKVSSSTLYLDYEEIGTTVVPGSTILLDDGLIGLEVNSISEQKFYPITDPDSPTDDGSGEYVEVKCTVQNGGKLGSVKGVNVSRSERGWAGGDGRAQLGKRGWARWRAQLSEPASAAGRGGERS
jgi:pyruvate kinase